MEREGSVHSGLDKYKQREEQYADEITKIDCIDML